MRDLHCPVCERRFPAAPDEPWQCPAGHPLEYADRPPLGAAPPTVDRDEGIWAFDAVLPEPRHPSLGEGWTPLVAAPAWETTFKLEYISPTRSFKDRGAAVLVGRAAALGVDRIIEDSSGNAGAAIAAYAANAGIDARIYVPATTPAAKRRRIEQFGAAVVPVEGSRQTVTDTCQAAVADGEGWYGSHAWHPAFYAGTATIAYEIAAQYGWDPPDAVVIPVGHGTLLLGAYRGFEAMVAADWTDEIPALYAVQAAGTAPLVDAIADTPPVDGSNDVADGVQIEAPARLAAVQSAVESSGGTAIAVGSTPTQQTLDRLHRHGFGVEPTAALAPAALDRLQTDGHIHRDDDVVVPLTGAGTPPT